MLQRKVNCRRLSCFIYKASAWCCHSFIFYSKLNHSSATILSAYTRLGHTVSRLFCKVLDSRVRKCNFSVASRSFRELNPSAFVSYRVVSRFWVVDAWRVYEADGTFNSIVRSGIFELSVAKRLTPVLSGIYPRHLFQSRCGPIGCCLDEMRDSSIFTNLVYFFQLFFQH